MAAFDYSRPLATANRLIERFGQAGVIYHPMAAAPNDYDPADSTPFGEDVRFVITSYTDREIDGTRVLATDKKALMAPGTITLDPDLEAQLVEADGSVWNIIPPVQVLRPAETTLLYTLQVRR